MNVLIGVMSHNADNYRKALQLVGISSIVSLDATYETACDGLLLPGGGDILPSLFGEKNTDSKDINSMEDILQLELFYRFFNHKKPILGICKGMQIINVALGGTLTQNLPTHKQHEYCEKDLYHITKALPGGIFHTLYGKTPVTNSAHHQGLNKLGLHLRATQFAFDNVIEGIEYSDAPILGTQWHPERMMPWDNKSGHVNGLILFAYYRNLLSAYIS